ncbi:hypothetical protein [Streptomyces sp. NPDC004682]
MAQASEKPQELTDWVAQELKKLLPRMTEDDWAEVWTVIGPETF